MTQTVTSLSVVFPVCVFLFNNSTDGCWRGEVHWRVVWTKYSCSSAEVSHGRGSLGVLLGLPEAAGDSVGAPAGLEASLELTLLRDRECPILQLLGAICCSPGTDTFWREKGAEGCPGLQLLSLTNSSLLTYQFFRLILDNQHCLCSLRAPFPRVLDVTQSGQKPVCYYATLLTFGFQNLELLWLLTT